MSNYEWYKEQVEKLHKDYQYTEWVFDITTIVVSSAGILLSTLVWARTAFALSLLFVLLGLRVNTVAIRRQLYIMYSMYTGSDCDDRNGWITVVRALNWASFVALSVGMMLLIKGVLI